MGHLSPPSGREVALNNWTLVFSNPHLEQEFRAHQTRVWGSMQIWRLKMNLLAGLINLSITSYFLSLGNIFTKQGFRILYQWCSPYMTVAIIHYCLGKRQQHRPCTSSLINHLGEACYSLICTLSMPTWVLRYSECTELKVFVRQLILGSGILIGIWLRFLTPAFFPVAAALTTLQFAFQAWNLTAPTCDALLDSQFSRTTLQQLVAGLDRVFSWSLNGAGAAAGADGSTAGSTAADLRSGCYSMMYALQLIAGGTLLYTSYRMERSNRRAFLQGRVRLVDGWPRVPALVQVALHAVGVLQLFAVVWVLLLLLRSGDSSWLAAAPAAAGAAHSRPAGVFSWSHLSH